MANNSVALIRLMDARLTEVFFNEWDSVPEEFSKVFRVLSTTKRQEEDMHLAGTKAWSEVGEGDPTPYEDIVTGNTVTYVTKTYKDGIQATMEAVEDEMYNVFDEAVADLANSGRATVEATAASILNNGFTTNGYDGVPLFSNSHTLPKGDTLDNLATGPLTDANLKAALLVGRRHVNNAGLKIMTNYTKLIVPLDLEYTAVTLTQSSQTAGTANNDVNAIRGKLEVIPLHYLSSSTAWFIQDPKASKLKFYWRVKPEFKRMTDFDSDIQKWRGRTRFSVGYSAPQGIVGSTGV